MMKWTIKGRARAWVENSTVWPGIPPKARGSLVRAIGKLMAEAYQRGRDDEANYQRSKKNGHH